MPVCGTCGQGNPEDARFCNACGAPLAAEQPAAREERKIVTVFFADLVGFTGRADQLDPEDVRAMLSPYYGRLRSEIERFGGTVEKFIGDAVMAVFGAPVVHEDDPECAVRAALAVRDAVSELNEADPSLDLHVRIAVNTGEAVVALGARPLEGEGMVAGDVVNTAARLQAAAAVDGILVGETTYRATERAIEYRAAEAVSAKGKAQPIPVWEPLGARARYGVDVRQAGGAPLVGRRGELDLLSDALARATRERTPQLLTLVGVPGIGKSRLVWELARAVDADPEQIVFWRQGRSLPYGEGVAFWAVAEMVKAQAGILETDSADVAETKLAETVADLVRDPAAVRWVESHLRLLVGLAGEAEGADNREEAFAAWHRFFEAMAERRPLVLVFEDLHWADDNLLDFVDYLAEWATDSPLLVIATARPELLERRPGWGGGKPNAATVSLSPLSEDEIARLLASLLEQAVMPAELQSQLLARAGGNPLYAEEYARMVSERGVTPTEDAPLPETVQGIVAARLDALSPEDKALLQDAAVIGKVFWSGALGAMNGLQRWTIEECLHRLERKEFVRRERRSSVATETEYAFRHVLVRDVAYAELPRALRAEKHRRAAEWIELLSADREDRAEMLAYHYLSALEFARAAGQAVDLIAERARVALRDAGDRAYALNAFAAATGFYRSAVDLWPVDAPGRGALLLRYGRSLYLSDWTADVAAPLEQARDLFLASGERVQAAEAEVALGDLYWFGSARELAAPHFEHAAALIDGVEPSRSKAVVLSELARFAMLGDNDALAVDLAQEALAMADEFGADEIRARALNILGVSGVKLGDRRALVNLERCLELTAESGSPERIRGLVNLATMLSELGELSRAVELHEEGLHEAERVGTPEMVRWLRAERLWDEWLIGRWDDALAHAEEFLAEVEAGHLHYMEGAVRIVRAMIRLARGEGSAAVSDSERALALARAAQDPQVLFLSLAYQSHVLVSVGRQAEARPLIDELLGRLQSSRSSLVSWGAMPLAAVLTALGRADDLDEVAQSATMTTRWLEAGRAYAAGSFEEAATILADMGAVADEAFARLRAAEALIQAGRRAEGDAQLQRALAFYRSVGATAFVREAESLFAASA